MENLIQYHPIKVDNVGTLNECCTNTKWLLFVGGMASLIVPTQIA